jgi:hypothetical protein
MIKRRGSWKVAIVTLSVVIDRVVGKILGRLGGICRYSASSLGMLSADGRPTA